MNEQNYNLPGWPGWAGPLRQNPIRPRTVSSFDELKKKSSEVPPGSMAPYFLDNEDIVFFIIKDDHGNTSYRGFNMSEFNIDEYSSMNGTITEGRLREEITNLENRIVSQFSNIANQLKEDVIHAQQLVRTEDNSAKQPNRKDQR